MRKINKLTGWRAWGGLYRVVRRGLPGEMVSEGDGNGGNVSLEKVCGWTPEEGSSGVKALR